MSWKRSKTAATALAALSLAALTTIIPTASASAEEVPCHDSSFLEVWYHYGNSSTQEICFANAGVYSFNGPAWLTAFSTGNNVVQWYGDGSWQPANGVGKWTYFTFPNHPGGVNMYEIAIW